MLRDGKFVLICANKHKKKKMYGSEILSYSFVSGAPVVPCTLKFQVEKTFQIGFFFSFDMSGMGKVCW